MKLIKTSLYSAIITIIRVGSGFVANKVIAVFTGPGGIALIGAFSNFISIALTFANGAINTGVVKYSAEYNDDELKSKFLYSTALRISISCSIIIGLVLLTFASIISDMLFTSSLYSNPIRVLGITVVLYSLNSLLISILNGKGEIKTYTIVNTVGSIIGLIFTFVLVYFYKLPGALYALVLAQSVVFFVTAILILRSKWFKWGFFNKSFNKPIAKLLFAFSLMTVVTSITGPVSQIMLRNMLMTKLGIQEAGYWQGMMRVSDGYLMIIVTSLSTYYLPKLSALKDNYEIRLEIFKGLKIILPALLVGCLVIFFSRFLLIKILYTKDFLEMESLFFWQLVGDFFKMAAWIVGYLMVAKAMTKLYIWTDILFSLSYVILGYVFVGLYGLNGITIAFALNYFVYLLLMIFLFRKLLFMKKLTHDNL